jgi:hypothetical protein
LLRQKAAWSSKNIIHHMHHHKTPPHDPMFDEMKSSEPRQTVYMTRVKRYTPMEYTYSWSAFFAILHSSPALCSFNSGTSLLF